MSQKRVTLNGKRKKLSSKKSKLAIPEPTENMTEEELENWQAEELLNSLEDEWEVPPIEDSPSTRTRGRKLQAKNKNELLNGMTKMETLVAEYLATMRQESVNLQINLKNNSLDVISDYNRKLQQINSKFEKDKSIIVSNLASTKPTLHAPIDYTEFDYDAAEQERVAKKLEEQERKKFKAKKEKERKKKIELAEQNRKIKQKKALEEKKRKRKADKKKLRDAKREEYEAEMRKLDEETDDDVEECPAPPRKKRRVADTPQKTKKKVEKTVVKTTDADTYDDSEMWQEEHEADLKVKAGSFSYEAKAKRRRHA